MTSRRGIYLRMVAASLAARLAMASLRGPQAAGARAGCRSGCARRHRHCARKEPRRLRGSVNFVGTRHIVRSSSLDLDFLRGLLRLRLFGQFYSEHALLEPRFDLISVNTLWQFKAALERAKTTLLQVIIL